MPQGRSYGAWTGNVQFSVGDFVLESAQVGIIGSTTRTQSAATPLFAEINRIDVSTAIAAGTTLGDGVMLMGTAGLVGVDIELINNTANVVTVYPASGTTDQINNLGVGVGVPVPPGDVAHFECPVLNNWYFEAGVGTAGVLPVLLATEGVIAATPALQSTATPLNAIITHITTVNVAGAAVALPAARYGLEVAVENATPNPLTVYPVNGGSDSVNGLAANAPILLPGFTTTLARAASNGSWQTDPYFNGAGAMPSTGGVAPGSAVSGVARSGGNLSVQVSAAGVGNTAVLTDIVLFNYALPATSLDAAGRQVSISAAGQFAANVNNKRVKFWWNTTTPAVGSAVVGGTLITDSGVVATNAGGWIASVQVMKYGALASNTQIATGAQFAAGVTHLGTATPALLTAAENAVINITVTGASPTTGAANDVLGQYFDIAFNN